MALNLSKRAAPKKPAAKKADPMAEILTALQASVGKMAAAKVVPVAVTFPVMTDVVGGELLLTNVMQAKALGTCPAVREETVMTHDLYGTITLRSVEYNDGYLIGLIDRDKATYAECEFFDTEAEMLTAWSDWQIAAKM